MGTIVSTNSSAKLLREQAQDLRVHAAECSTAAERLRNQAAEQERQADEMTKRANEYESTATSLSN
jgi:uncharacterized coiled-coil DUF342 family protein